ncbi:tRNA (adenosine(37)-N6)-threonylcarbamoyltransferase complex transferase subunit TsaD [Candidatus Kuenenbacteria bacterium]|nr:tRNA (adenosine(37)-N6)-threonylcarbamoyltransferase complex transferase subunit TsaD [Candidatus Kuenenbacteria bacterium]
MLILGIESSCDETAAALVEIKKGKIKIISNVISSQIKIHQKYGGVVPEMAARAHLENILPVITKALGKKEKSIFGGSTSKCGVCQLADLRKKEKKIDLIAVTVGPGLITSLLVGIETAKVLAYLWNKPIIGVNHLEGHIYANFIGKIFNFQFSIFKQIQNSIRQLADKCQMFPAICLIVSGGHTELILMKDHLKYKKIGQTKDDAAGEAFDKVAKMLNLNYPGGPAIAEAAMKIKKLQATSYKLQANFPRPMINSGDYDFSFSGLKTAVLYQLKKDKDWQKKIPEYCYEFQQAIIDVLIFKTLKAAKEYKVKTIILSGGVAANNELRKQFNHQLQVTSYKLQANFLVPSKNLCTDNAVMITVAGYFNFCKKGEKWQKLKPDSNLEL